MQVVARVLNRSQALFTCLLIQDVPDSRVASALAEVGCEIVVDAQPPDLVVIDIAEPVETCRKLASRLRGVPIVAIVAEHEFDTVFEAGARDCVRRPARPAELTARLRAALRERAEHARRSKRERKLTEVLRKLEHEKQDLERIVCVDALTGVANRRHAMSLLDGEWRRSARDGSQLSLVMIDLDYFHAYNEHYGHLGGDACLRRVTDVMVGSLRRPSDFLGRYGGEEFVAVLAATDAVGARIVAERLRAAVEAIAIPHAAAPAGRVTISVGFATCRASLAVDADFLVAAADSALLAAKAAGRNRISGDAPAAPPPRVVPSQPWTRFPIVVADPWYADRIPKYLAARRDEARELDEALHAGAFDRIRMFARRLKTSAMEHGIPHIGQLGMRLDHAARAEDRDAVRGTIDELELYIDHVQVTYRRPERLAAP